MTHSRVRLGAEFRLALDFDRLKSNLRWLALGWQLPVSEPTPFETAEPDISAT